MFQRELTPAQVKSMQIIHYYSPEARQARVQVNTLRRQLKELSDSEIPRLEGQLSAYQEGIKMAEENIPYWQAKLAVFLAQKEAARAAGVNLDVTRLYPSSP